MKRHTLAGWIVRDTMVLLLLATLLAAVYLWESAGQTVATTLISSITGFMAAYITCYVAHEWGHLAGAKLSSSQMPYGAYKGILIGYFDLKTHTRRQFLAMSWGGVAAYLTVATLAVMTWMLAPPATVISAFAVGGLAFVSQSLAVDLPIICKVHKGSDIERSANSGAAPNVILKRTWQTWVPLTIVLLIWGQLA